MKTEEQSGLPEVISLKPRGRRPAAPIEYLMTLRRRGLSHRQIAELVHTDRSAISHRLSEVDDSLRWTEDYVKDRALILAYHQRRIITFLTDAKLQKASARDLIISLGVLYDKERLETGKSTSNIAYADVLQARLNKQSELRSLMDARAMVKDEQ